MRLYLINPSNPLAYMDRAKGSRWKQFRIWKPLSLMVLAGLTPREWDMTIIDENFGMPEYSDMPRPDLVGITAFTSQANRAYAVAAYFRSLGVPVIMGGIHATMCQDEASGHVDSVVTGEADGIWPQVLEDMQHGTLKPLYHGGFADIDDIPFARHDLLSTGYAMGAIQTTRGCPLNCSFCSVTAFNGSRYRQRPIPDVVREFQLIREKHVLVVDDNLIGTRPDHIARAKALFRALAQANLRKHWIAQATVNFADDEELLALAAKAGCRGVFIGFESPETAGLMELGKKYNLLKERNFRDSVRRIQRHNILVVGSFIIGLDIDVPGVGKRIADAADQYGVDSLNVLFLTPLPGTRLWDQMKEENRIALNMFPEDWQYYTLTYPVARYKNFSLESIIQERISCKQRFYGPSRMLLRGLRNVWQRRHPLYSVLGSISYKGNIHMASRRYAEFNRVIGSRLE